MDNRLVCPIIAQISFNQSIEYFVFPGKSKPKDIFEVCKGKLSGLIKKKECYRNVSILTTYLKSVTDVFMTKYMAMFIILLWKYEKVFRKKI